MSLPLRAAFVPLLDAAPLIVAREMGFAAEEGLALELVAAPSWSALRDLLAFGKVEAAHMLAPLPVAMALGLGGIATATSALMVTSLNGTAIGLGTRLADRLSAAGHPFDFRDARRAGTALITASRPEGLRIGVPFPFSMHAQLIHYWLTACGLPPGPDIQIRTVPPPMMAEALADGDIDAFCVGEPWGSRAVETGAGALLLPGRAIWSAAPEKVLAVRSAFAAEDPERTGRLMRALYKACRWLAQPASRTAAAEILARRAYLDLPPDIIDRALTGQFIINPRGDGRTAPGFVSFFEGAATFPWRSQAAWIASQLARQHALNAPEALNASRAVFRPDLYRSHLASLGAIMPGASEKVEGGIAADAPAASQTGRLFLPENQFFDGRTFDPRPNLPITD